MKFIEHLHKQTRAVEIVSDDILISSEQDALDMMADIGYRYDCRKIIMHKGNFCDDFFILKTGLAGAVLQKFSNYRVQLAIIGDFSENKSRSLNDFIYECNKSKQIFFLDDIPSALNELC